MSIQISCPGCAKSFSVDDKFAGKTGKCPNCKTSITVPEKKPDVKIHTPETFSSGGKTVSGKLALKPIARQQTRIKPLAAAAIGGGVLAALVYAAALRGGWVVQASDTFRYLVRGLGLALVGPPLAIAAYTFLRDDELEPHRGMQLYIRAAICGLVYALLWGLFAYVRVQGFGSDAIDLPMWFVIIPPFFLVGGFAGKFAFDLETANGFFHYAFYVAVTVVLAMIAKISLLG